MKKKFLPKKITAAETEDTRLDDTLDRVDDDFDYIISGLDMLGRSGKKDVALQIAVELQNAMQGFISEIAEEVGE